MFVVKVKGGFYLTRSENVTPTKAQAFRFLDPNDAKSRAKTFSKSYGKKTKVKRF